LRALVRKAGQWSRANRVPVWVGEFGVRAQDAPSADRLRWLRAATTAFADERLPWSLWSYDDCFGLGLGQGVKCRLRSNSSEPAAGLVCDTLSAIRLGSQMCGRPRTPETPHSSRL
jgi:hypothetical protein